MPSELHTLYRAQPGAKQLFDWILQADHPADPGDTRTTMVKDLVDHLRIPKRTAIGLLRSLGELGMGEFKVGRKGHPTRFEWSADPRALLGSIAADIEDDTSGSPRARVSPALCGPEPGTHAGDGPFRDIFDHDSPLPAISDDVTTPRTAAEAALIEHSYVLRPELRVIVALPEDLSAREAEVLGDWIRNLSFER